VLKRKVKTRNIISPDFYKPFMAPPSVLYGISFKPVNSVYPTYDFVSREKPLFLNSLKQTYGTLPFLILESVYSPSLYISKITADS
jgi:hypothetical protein